MVTLMEHLPELADIGGGLVLLESHGPGEFLGENPQTIKNGLRSRKKHSSFSWTVAKA